MQKTLIVVGASLLALVLFGGFLLFCLILFSGFLLFCLILFGGFLFCLVLFGGVLLFVVQKQKEPVYHQAHRWGYVQIEHDGTCLDIDKKNSVDKEKPRCHGMKHRGSL